MILPNFESTISNYRAKATNELKPPSTNYEDWDYTPMTKIPKVYENFNDSFSTIEAVLDRRTVVHL